MVLPIVGITHKPHSMVLPLGLYKIIRKNLQLRRQKDIKYRFE